jgi:hypothetical protein
VTFVRPSLLGVRCVIIALLDHSTELTSTNIELVSKKMRRRRRKRRERKTFNVSFCFSQIVFLFTMLLPLAVCLVVLLAIALRSVQRPL